MRIHILYILIIGIYNEQKNHIVCTVQKIDILTHYRPRKFIAWGGLQI